MHQESATTISAGQKALAELLKSIDATKLDWTEADTRFRIIDHLIVACLGWDKRHIACEKAEGRDYTDYELGSPRKAIWEAKRHGKVFLLPSNPNRKMLRDLQSILALGGDVADAIKQAQSYCAGRGVEVAVATNGHQLIAFLAVRTDGVSPLAGQCLVVDGYAQLADQFPLVWQMLSPNGIADRKLYRLLNHGSDRAVPAKIAIDIPTYRSPRYPSTLQESLRTIGELLLVDAAESEVAERRFYEECYCKSGAVSQHALLSKNILSERYALLFEGEVSQPRVTKLTNPKRGKLQAIILSEALSKRPIVLLGDVGVGKSSFLKYLLLLGAEDELEESFCIYIDLGTKGALSDTLKLFVVSEIEQQLLERYGVDIVTDEFIREVYAAEIERFDKGLHGARKHSDPARYEVKLLDLLDEKCADRAAHASRSIKHLSESQKKQIVIVLDNADQRTYDIQQEAFVISENFAKDWDAVVFYAIRPSTFFKSKQSGALSAYQNRVFTIDPPRIDEVVVKRLQFALNMAEGKIEVKKLYRVKLQLSNIVFFLEALVLSLKRNRGILEFLTNISGGNVRLVIELITKFMGSSNVDSEKYIKTVQEKGWHFIPTHEFWKSALLGDYAYYDPVSSVAMNLFDVTAADAQNHFLVPLMLGYLNWEGAHRGPEGFVATTKIFSELQSVGFTVQVIEDAIRRANNKKLIEAPKRLTFAEDEAGLYGDMASGYRITTVGAYHVDRWITEFSYLDAMCVDTPIFDDEVKAAIAENINSFGISERLDRATRFRDYLSKVWRSASLHRPYFDWKSRLQRGARSFALVIRAVKAANQEEF